MRSADKTIFCLQRKSSKIKLRAIRYFKSQFLCTDESGSLLGYHFVRAKLLQNALEETKVFGDNATINTKDLEKNNEGKFVLTVHGDQEINLLMDEEGNIELDSTKYENQAEITSKFRMLESVYISNLTVADNVLTEKSVQEQENDQRKQNPQQQKDIQQNEQENER